MVRSSVSKIAPGVFRVRLSENINATAVNANALAFTA